jgi:hypothetical protein
MKRHLPYRLAELIFRTTTLRYNCNYSNLIILVLTNQTYMGLKLKPVKSYYAFSIRNWNAHPLTNSAFSHFGLYLNPELNVVLRWNSTCDDFRDDFNQPIFHFNKFHDWKRDWKRYNFNRNSRTAISMNYIRLRPSRKLKTSWFLNREVFNLSSRTAISMDHIRLHRFGLKSSWFQSWFQSLGP